MNRACNYVIYRFRKGERINLNDASHILAITPQTFYRLPYREARKIYTYIVTALDRLHNESKPVYKEKVKL